MADINDSTREVIEELEARFDEHVLKKWRGGYLLKLRGYKRNKQDDPVMKEG